MLTERQRTHIHATCGREGGGEVSAARVILLTVAGPAGQMRHRRALRRHAREGLAASLGDMLGVGPARPVAEHRSPPRPGSRLGERALLSLGTSLAAAGVADGDLLLFRRPEDATGLPAAPPPSAMRDPLPAAHPAPMHGAHPGQAGALPPAPPPLLAAPPPRRPASPARPATRHIPSVEPLANAAAARNHARPAPSGPSRPNARHAACSGRRLAGRTAIPPRSPTPRAIASRPASPGRPTERHSATGCGSPDATRPATAGRLGVPGDTPVPGRPNGTGGPVPARPAADHRPSHGGPSHRPDTTRPATAGRPAPPADPTAPAGRFPPAPPRAAGPTMARPTADHPAAAGPDRAASVWLRAVPSQAEQPLRGNTPGIAPRPGLEEGEPTPRQGAPEHGPGPALPRDDWGSGPAPDGPADGDAGAREDETRPDDRH